MFIKVQHGYSGVNKLEYFSSPQGDSKQLSVAGEFTGKAERNQTFAEEAMHYFKMASLGHTTNARYESSCDRLRRSLHLTTPLQTNTSAHLT